MPDPRLPLDAVRDVLELARRDRVAAGKRVAELPIEEQLALVCDAPVSRRRLLLDLLPAPERVVPLIPEAELVFTVKAIGLDGNLLGQQHRNQHNAITGLRGLESGCSSSGFSRER